MHTVLTKVYPPPPIDRNEIFRYAGARKDLPEFRPLLNDCLDLLHGKLSYKVCFCELPLIPSQSSPFPFGVFRSIDLQKNLADCSRAVVFAATLGIELDRLIYKYSRKDTAKALFLQAIGAERIEALCDVFCQDLSLQAEQNGECLCPRFSPGYGDFPLDAQKTVFALLDCPKRIGLSLNESLLMSPSKSVTAIVGIKRSPKII